MTSWRKEKRDYENEKHLDYKYKGGDRPFLYISLRHDSDVRKLVATEYGIIKKQIINLYQN